MTEEQHEEEIRQIVQRFGTTVGDVLKRARLARENTSNTRPSSINGRTLRFAELSPQDVSAISLGKWNGRMVAQPPTHGSNEPEEGSPEYIRRRFFPNAQKNNPNLAWMELLWVCMSHPLIIAWANLVEVWTTCAIDPHQTTPDHDILWSQIVGWGWNAGIYELNARFGSDKEDWSVWTVLWRAQASWLEGSKVNGVKGGEAERLEVVSSVKSGFENGKEGVIVTGVLRNLNSTSLLPGVSEDLWMAQGFTILLRLGDEGVASAIVEDVAKRLTPEWATAREIVVPPILWERGVDVYPPTFHYELEITRASLFLAKITQEALRRFSLTDFILTREEAEFGCMKIFMLEHGQPQNDSAEETSLHSMMPSHSDIPCLPVCSFLRASMQYALDYRKHLWCDFNHVVKTMRVLPEQVLSSDIREYLYPIETDSQILGSYLSSLLQGKLQGFMRWLNKAIVNEERASTLFKAVVIQGDVEVVREVVQYRQPRANELVLPPSCFDHSSEVMVSRSEYIMRWMGQNTVDRLKSLLDLL
ncbi:hypothetical protein BYT27DRAFT_7245870 [Phlegmacium glaucopus]|nr:hypothetical protein BYT27DRAFT_7245870 [Phlegmacium glaucopus]